MFVHKLNDPNKITKRTIVTIGNYDGFHTGHKFLISQLNNLARKENLRSVLITFNPHTKSVIVDKNFKVLTTFKDKVTLSKELSIDFLCEVNFDKNIKDQSFKDFIDIVIRKYNPAIILLGYDNKIGKNKKGDFRILKNYLSTFDIIVKKCDVFLDLNKTKVTTTLIKDHISRYKIEEANAFLGRLYSIEGKIVKGENIGKSLGFPTANVEIKSFEQLIPPNGVYSVTLVASGVNYKSICNIGYCPTIKDNSSNISIEVHVINKNIQLYGMHVVVRFKSFIRKEKKFKNKLDLKMQIDKDIKKVI